MKYYFANLRHISDEDGWEPDLPAGAGFCLLADARSIRWGLYSCSGKTDPEGHPGVDPVSAELEALLASAERYPPALALAREEMSQLFLFEAPTREEFSRALVSSLISNFSAQANSPFLLARAVNEEIGYLTPDEWHWIVGFTDGERPTVQWVSDDFYVYRNYASDFDLDPDQCAALAATVLGGK